LACNGSSERAIGLDALVDICVMVLLQNVSLWIRPATLVHRTVRHSGRRRVVIVPAL